MGTTARGTPLSGSKERATQIISISNLSPLVALVAGILILFVPRLLSLIVAIYLIVVGVLGLAAQF